MKPTTISLGPLSGVKLRTRVRLATITELIKDGQVLATGVATIHPGEEHKMNFRTGAQLSGERAISGFFDTTRAISHAMPLARIPRLMLSDSINQDERQAKLALSRVL